MAGTAPAQPRLTPLQRVVYEVHQLDLDVRESIRIVSQRVGFFVGQQRYLDELRKVDALVARYGPSVLEGGTSPTAEPRSTADQVGSPS